MLGSSGLRPQHPPHSSPHVSNPHPTPPNVCRLVTPLPPFFCFPSFRVSLRFFPSFLLFFSLCLCHAPLFVQRMSEQSRFSHCAIHPFAVTVQSSDGSEPFCPWPLVLHRAPFFPRLSSVVCPLLPPLSLLFAFSLALHFTSTALLPLRPSLSQGEQSRRNAGATAAAAAARVASTRDSTARCSWPPRSQPLCCFLFSSITYKRSLFFQSPIRQRASGRQCDALPASV